MLLPMLTANVYVMYFVHDMSHLPIRISKAIQHRLVIHKQFSLFILLLLGGVIM